MSTKVYMKRDVFRTFSILEFEEWICLNDIVGKWQCEYNPDYIGFLFEDELTALAFRLKFRV